jgi:hypothetical protein
LFIGLRIVVGDLADESFIEYCVPDYAHLGYRVGWGYFVFSTFVDNLLFQVSLRAPTEEHTAFKEAT